MLRTHTCGELRKKDVKKEIELSGWMHSRRDHGNLIFVDIRDRYGLTQIVFDPKDSKESHKVAETLRREDVIHIKGGVRARGEGLENPKIDTGEIEILVQEIEILNKSETPPLEVDDNVEAGEDLRLKYRYLDLRRPIMQKRLVVRHNIAKATREYLNSKSFLEIETPLLIRATPEGARDYVVPSRTNPGKFYSLPQSPQLYKQILMVSGMDRYYQLAKCLRDEDLRQDRQPEFTQIDMELSFVNEDDIYEICEGMIAYIWKEVKDIKLKLPFPRIKYVDAMEKYGIDKPDIRFELYLTDVTDIAKKADFQVFKDASIIKCINPEKNFSRKELDAYITETQKWGAKGMAWMRVTKDGLDSNIAKYFKPEVQKELIKKVGAKEGSVLMFIADKPAIVNDVLSRLRNKLGKDLRLIDENDFKFIWITHFPLFEHDEESDRWTPMHHIFSMPHEECVKDLHKNPGKVTGKLYDLALNGTELGGGSIRIHRKDLQEEVLQVIGMTYEEAEERFGFLLNAFKYGAPPHGGIAFGLDRISALINGTNDIREVIAFPKNKNAECPMDGSPGDITETQMKELHIKSDLAKKK